MVSHVSVSTMRELHKVTTERDQLRFELEKVRMIYVHDRIIASSSD